jgi:uncharacterized protein (DUF2344 family)
MDENNLNLGMSPEEQNAELEATKEVNEDELREKLAGELGIDPDSEENEQLLEKLIAREKANHERLSVAIKQKIGWREKASAQSTSANLKENSKDKKPNIDSADKSLELTRALIREEFEERDLKILGLPEEVLQDVRDWAKVRNITVREAAELPYIKTRIDDIKKEKSLLEASTKRSKKGDLRVGELDLSKALNPDDFKTESGDLDTVKWDQAKAARERYISRQR